MYQYIPIGSGAGAPFGIGAPEKYSNESINYNISYMYVKNESLIPIGIGAAINPGNGAGAPGNGAAMGNGAGADPFGSGAAIGIGAAFGKGAAVGMGAPTYQFKVSIGSIYRVRHHTCWQRCCIRHGSCIRQRRGIGHRCCIWQRCCVRQWSCHRSTASRQRRSIWQRSRIW